MYELYDEINIYSPEDVLNPFFLLLNNDFPKSFYQYFKKLNRPEHITSITGIQIEVNKDITFHSFLKELSCESIEILQLNLNKPLKLKNNLYFLTIFNISEESIISVFPSFLDKHKKEKLIIGIFMCHPLTTVNEFITQTDNQLINARKNNCVISVLNLLDY